MLACSNLNNFTVNGYGEVFAHFLPIFYVVMLEREDYLKTTYFSVIFHGTER